MCSVHNAASRRSLKNTAGDFRARCLRPWSPYCTQVQRALAALAFRSEHQAVFDAVISSVSCDHLGLVLILPGLAPNACDHVVSIRGPTRMIDNILQCKRHVVQLGDARAGHRVSGVGCSSLSELQTVKVAMSARWWRGLWRCTVSLLQVNRQLV